jgi:hypothetical protein
LSANERNQSQTQRQEKNVVTINSTIISGAGAIPAIRPLLAGKNDFYW